MIMLYEDPTKDPSSDERFHVELHFSPGVNCCVQKDLPPGPGFRPHSRNHEQVMHLEFYFSVYTKKQLRFIFKTFYTINLLFLFYTSPSMFFLIQTLKILNTYVYKVNKNICTRGGIKRILLFRFCFDFVVTFLHLILTLKKIFLTFYIWFWLPIN